MISLPLLPITLLALLAGTLLPLGGDTAQGATAAPLNSLELHAILAHGPWPVTPGPDPSNPVSGQPAAIEFGYRMFREPRMSANGYVTCVACHQTDRGFTDGIARAHALAPVDRNTPALANLRLQQRYGWLGSSDSLWQASLRPLLDAREFGSSPARVAHVVRIGDGLACRYERSFGMLPSAQADGTVATNVAKALAAFQETLTTGRTPFDDYRDALAGGDRSAASRYPIAAQRGARLFVGKGRCAACHAGPNFSDGALHDRLRTPSLRNVAVTAPYLHDGRATTLHEAVRWHRRASAVAAPGSGPMPAAPPELDAADLDDVVAFLETLTDSDGATRRWPPLARSSCP